MRNNKIAVSWNKIMPDGAADERMLSGILERSRSAGAGNAEAKRTAKKKAVWLRYVAAAAAVVVIAVGMFAVVRFGSESKQQQAAEPVDTPDPYEGVYYRAIEPVEKPVRGSSASRIDLTKEFIAKDAAFIFKGIVQSMKEYEVLCVREDKEGYPKQYTTRVECTVTDPIYGDLNIGEAFYTLYASSSYNHHEDDQLLENGKEYIFMIYKFRENVPQEEIVFDWPRLCPYTLLSSREGFMPVDGDTVRYHIVLGDLGIEGAELNGTIKAYTQVYKNRGEAPAYTAKYEDVKEKLQEIMSVRKGATPPAATATPIPIEISTPAPETSETSIKEND